MLSERLKEALAALKKAKLGGGGAKYLYQLPWYMFIGPPGAGKTTALVNAGLKFPLADAQGRAAGGARRRRHPQLRLVVHRRGGADRHRRPLHHAGQQQRGRQQRLARLPETAQAAPQAPAAERRAGGDQPVRPGEPERRGARRARAGDPQAHPRAARPARRAHPGLCAVHQGRSGRRLHGVLRRSRQRGARAGLGRHLQARRRPRRGRRGRRASPPSSTRCWRG